MFYKNVLKNRTFAKFNFFVAMWRQGIAPVCGTDNYFNFQITRKNFSFIHSRLLLTLWQFAPKLSTMHFREAWFHKTKPE